MLRIRIITALIILPVTLAVVFLTPPWLFRLSIALLLLTGCWEFRRLANLAPAAGWALMILQTLIIATMMYFWAALEAEALVLLAAACASWLLMYLRLFQFADGATADGRYQRLGFLSALGAVTFCWFSLSWLRSQADGQSTLR